VTPVNASGQASAAAVPLAVAQARGMISVLPFAGEVDLVTHDQQPVRITVTDRSATVQINRIDGSANQRATAYGPAGGTLTINAGPTLKVLRNGKLLRHRAAVSRPPRTVVTVRRRGRRATLRISVHSRNGVHGTFMILNRRTRPVGRTLNLTVAQARRARFFSIDAFGNQERPHRAGTP
jgi:hypothetical protein